MFTRSSSAGPKTLEPRTPDLNRTGPQGRAGAPEKGTKSVIGNDLKIVGQGLKIISGGLLQVDGEIEGDVQGDEVTIGEQGQSDGHGCGATGRRPGQNLRRHLRQVDCPASLVQGSRRHPSYVARHRAWRRVRWPQLPCYPRVTAQFGCRWKERRVHHLT